jgi:hypothetical protein
MSWIITPTYDGLISDADATAYLAAVQAVDGQLLEPATRQAINTFVVGCKSDGIWTAIKASCILAGARTLAGALVPLVGAAPTPFAFLEADYNRKTGLVGNGSSKYLNSNRNNNADPQNNRHAVAYANPPDNSGKYLIGARAPGTDVGSTQVRQSSFSACLSNVDSGDIIGAEMPINIFSLKGVSRSSLSSYIARVNNNNYAITRTSTTAANQLLYIFNRTDLAASTFSNARIAFYSIGESLDLALLDARVTALIAAISTAF